MKDNILAGVVTFNPDIDLLKRNLLAVKKQIHEIIIFDNASKNIDEIKNISEDSLFNCTIISSDRNVGIAKALNEIMKIAQSRGSNWVLTLDQDTIIPNNLVEEYIKYTSFPDVAIICPQIVDRNIDYSTIKKPSKNFCEVDSSITSASLTNVSAWNNIGGFDEAMFIDFVDDDFCINLRNHRYKILKTSNVFISHAIGNIKRVNFFGKETSVYNHSAMRKYYQIRNRYYIDYKYKGRVTCVAIYFTIIASIKIIFWENHKLEKLYACLCGVRDGFSRKWMS